MQCNRPDQDIEYVPGDDCLPNQAPPHKEPGSLYVNDGLFLRRGNDCTPERAQLDSSVASTPEGS